MSSLVIKDLHTSIDNKEILKGVNLTINSNEIHVILGPNGVGKSTLCASLMGNPKYSITKGNIFLDDMDITNYEVNEKSKEGLFLAFQYPLEIDGLVISDFLKNALVAHDKKISFIKFALELNTKLEQIGLPREYAFRYLNAGLSGGEKKKLEILQLMLLQPKFAFLDEIDSGLDVDALKIVAKNILETIKENNMGVLLITHYDKIFEYITPTNVHIMIDGKIVVSGKEELITKIQNEGFEWAKNE
ncbi:MAG: Fe-S cluster assembly ATPase SufC [Acholeplasmatales bacterium]|jgi:Fe-S cluster assembly ATP-binding protein|nr:Fe-S cluster assembly ATPase SufC [Acholeplasmatales bacterium]